MEFIKFEKEDYIGIITINRPQALNALNSQVLDELNEVLDSVDSNETRALILTGEGDKSFVAGADIGEMSTLTKAEGEAFGKKGNDVFRKLETLEIPVIAATNKVMEKTGLTVDDMDLIEANEAFAAQSVAVAKDLNFDMDKVNVNGGAIALGHPVGASGCRILVTLLHEMQKRDAKKGLATLCIGGGMGCATIVERD